MTGAVDSALIQTESRRVVLVVKSQTGWTNGKPQVIRIRSNYRSTVGQTQQPNPSIKVYRFGAKLSTIGEKIFAPAREFLGGTAKPSAPFDSGCETHNVLTNKEKVRFNRRLF
jgi:hypothetical protein